MKRESSGVYSENVDGVMLIVNRTEQGMWYWICNGGKFGDRCTWIGGEDLYVTKYVAELSGKQFIKNSYRHDVYGWVVD